MTNKALIIYHANCMDGFAANWAAYRGLKHTAGVDVVTSHAAQYGEEPPYHLIDIDTAIYIVDFSYPWETLLKLTEHAKKVVLLDHHKTAIEALQPMMLASPKNLRMVLDTTRSGAMLTWNHFYPNDMRAPKIIQHVQDRDLWHFKMQGTKEFHMYLSTIDRTVEAWEDLHQAIDCVDECMHNYEMGLAVGGAILRYHEGLVDTLASKPCPISIRGFSGFVVNCPGVFASDVGHNLANACKMYGCTWYVDSRTLDAIISLRSNDDYDVSEIAKEFGGGGHKNAAGFKMPMHMWLEYLS